MNKETSTDLCQFVYTQTPKISYLSYISCIVNYSSIEQELKSQFSTTFTFMYQIILYKKDKLIIRKSRKYQDSYYKEKCNFTQCSFKLIIVHIFYTFFILLAPVFLSCFIKLFKKSETAYYSQTQSYR